MWSVHQYIMFYCLLQNSWKSSGPLEENQSQQKFLPQGLTE